ncbi:MAG: vanadium-dependent haloperoxidase [Saprospiraceae bacterium]|nr:vanadium-dependent haloperoxidase [Saprospiraceae bacterium]
MKSRSDNYDNELKSIVIQWYALYLDLEQSDVSAYPVVSSERLAEMGIGGYQAIFSGHELNYKNHSSLFVLNNVYSFLLLKYYKIQNKSSELKILKLHEDIENSLIKSVILNNDETSKAIKICAQAEKVLCGFSDQRPVNHEINKITEKYIFKSTNPILPNWGEKNTIITRKNKSYCTSPYHNATSFENAIFDDALAIYTLSMNLSKEDIWVAEFWSDDVRGLTFSPSSRWISISNQIVTKKEIGAQDLMTLYLKLGVGLYDAGIICWQEKYTYMLGRPESYIKANISKSWEPLHATPSFPSYPSGHAVFGAVASNILEAQFGAYFSVVDKSHASRIEFEGKERTFHSFREMAQENAYSRMLLGVHFKEDCDKGLKLGYEISKIIINTPTDELTGNVMESVCKL